MHSVPVAMDIGHRKTRKKLGNAATSEIDVLVRTWYARLANSTKNRGSLLLPKHESGGQKPTAHPPNNGARNKQQTQPQGCGQQQRSHKGAETTTLRSHKGADTTTTQPQGREQQQRSHKGANNNNAATKGASNKQQTQPQGRGNNNNAAARARKQQQKQG